MNLSSSGKGRDLVPRCKGIVDRDESVETAEVYHGKLFAQSKYSEIYGALESLRNIGLHEMNTETCHSHDLHCNKAYRIFYLGRVRKYSRLQ